MGIFQEVSRECGISFLLAIAVSSSSYTSCCSVGGALHRVTRSLVCRVDVGTRYRNGKYRSQGASFREYFWLSSGGRKCARTAGLQVSPSFEDRWNKWVLCGEVSFILRERRLDWSSSSRVDRLLFGQWFRRLLRLWMSLSHSWLRRIVLQGFWNQCYNQLDIYLHHWYGK